MSSNGEKRMMKRSDFAQKLLNDLRMRKEHLSISKDNYAYSNKGARAKSTTFQDFNSFNSGIEAVSNQIVPYGKGKSMEKIDLSKALAFALENAGKATKADPSGNASIISFLHEVGKRSLGNGNREIRRSSQQQSSSSSQQLPMIHFHIKEISKGTQKLNQIIKACSNGLSFRKGRYSIQCGEQLMEGAIELEESLRLLVDIQQASEYTTNKHRRNRIKLLEENDDHEEEEEDDAQYRNQQKINAVAKADIEMRVLALNYQEDKNNKHRKQTSSFDGTELKPQHKGRIPNVVAKLMGLGEFPQVEKEAKNIKSAENLTKTQRNSRTLDLVIHKETQNSNEVNYKTKSHQKDRGVDDLSSRKRNKLLYKKDGELTAKNVIRKNLSPTEKKHKSVPRSQQQSSHKLKLNFHNSWEGEEEKSMKKEKLQQEKPQENGVVTKAKVHRRSFCHVEVAQKVKEDKIREKKTQDISNQNGGLCKVMKRSENQKPNSKDEKLLTSYKDSNKIKPETETSIKSSQVAGFLVQSSKRNDLVEHKKEIKDDSIMLIAAERVPCKTPSENKHHGLIFTDGIYQQATLSKSDTKSEKLSKILNKVSGTKEVLEPGLPLLEKRQEHIKQETTEPLSENEINLKNIVVKSQLFLDTAKPLFKLNIPPNFIHDHVDGNSYYQEDKNLILDCGYELMKRKGRFQELSVHPFVKVPISSSKENTLDNLVRQLSKEFEKLRAYGRECYTGSFVEDYLPKVLERDVNHKDLTLNSMWDIGWNDLMLVFIEKDDVIRDIERQIFIGLIEEITRDLICI